jgi:uncharacterized damage-inducible protein DinB
MTQSTANTATMVDVLRRHLEPTLDMLGQTISACPDALWDARDEGPPFWQYAYHALVGLDFWLSDSLRAFAFPAFHTREALIESGETPQEALPREQIEAYREQVVAKSRALLDRLTPEALTEEAEFAGNAWTAADRILVQIRHVQHHVGQLNAMLKRNAVETPGWVGYNE